MFIQSKIITLLLIIVHGCIAVEGETENCDRVQFSFSDQTSTDSIHTFTKQSFIKNGKPVYYSVFGVKGIWRYSVIWWDNKTNWLSQTKRSNFHLISDKITEAKLKISNQNLHILIFLK